MMHAWIISGKTVRSINLAHNHMAAKPSRGASPQKCSLMEDNSASKGNERYFALPKVTIPHIFLNKDGKYGKPPKIAH
jgi:hypothetical protein